MMFEFESLENPEWIKKREEQWKLIEWRYSDELSRKERESLKWYFIKGNFPEVTSYPIGYITLLKLFPFQSKEGHMYVFKNFPAKLEWTSKGLGDFVCQLLLDNSELLTFEERLLQFRWYMGERFSVSVKFPFLIGQETECRNFEYDHRLVLTAMLQNLERWLAVDSSEWEWWDTNNLEHILLDFIFALLKVQYADCASGFFEVAYKKIECDDRDIQEKRAYLYRLVRGLMRKAFIKNISDNNENCKDKKKSVLESVEGKFNAMSENDFPQALIEHWACIKKRNIVILVDFTVESDFFEKWVEFYVRWSSSFNSHSDLLDREETLSFLDDGAIKKFELLESFFGSGDLFFEDIGASFNGDSFKSLFSSSSEEIGNHLESFFASCLINKLQVKFLPVG